MQEPAIVEAVKVVEVTEVAKAAAVPVVLAATQVPRVREEGQWGAVVAACRKSHMPDTCIYHSYQRDC